MNRSLQKSTGLLVLLSLLLSAQSFIAMLSDQPMGIQLEEDQIIKVEQAIKDFVRTFSADTPVSLYMTSGRGWESALTRRCLDFQRVLEKGVMLSRIAHFVFNNYLVFTFLLDNREGSADLFKVDFTTKLIVQGVINPDFVEQLRQICNSPDFECTCESLALGEPVVVLVNF